MSRLGFLFDEHIPHMLAHALMQRDDTMRLFLIGKDDAPAIGTPDADLLLWIEAHPCYLVTHNRASMPHHLERHLELKHRVPGMLVITLRRPFGQLVEDLYVYWAAAEEGDFANQIVYV